jgi:hypothetical protein
MLPIKQKGNPPIYLVERLKMPNNKKVEKKPYITIETDATGIDWNTNESYNLQDTPTPREWKALEALFVRHPTLVRISAPYRDPEIKEELTNFEAVPELAPQRKTKGSPGKGAEMNLKDWIFFFAHGFRYEAAKMSPSDAQFFGSFLKERTLGAPCQIEALHFTDPYCYALLFLFDQTKKDLRIRIRQAKWSNLEGIISNLLKEYSALQIARSDFHGLLKGCKDGLEGKMYGMNFVRNACIIYFTHDPRRKRSRALPFPVLMNFCKPAEAAEMIFWINISQFLN